MSDLYWLTDEQMARLEPYFPKSHGRPWVDDRRVLSGIIFVNRNGLRWRDAPKDYGPHKTLYNRWKRWGEMGVFTRMMEGLSAAGAERPAEHGRKPPLRRGGSLQTSHKALPEHDFPLRRKTRRRPFGVGKAAIRQAFSAARPSPPKRPLFAARKFTTP